MLDQMLPHRTVIGVLRGSSVDTATELALAAIEAGLTALEVTFTLPDAPGIIERLKHEAGTDCRIGAGTVLTVGQVADAAAAGADYLVSPNLDPAVQAAASEAGLLHVPGVLTPTELQQALELGAPLVKVFPVARLGGPAYLRDLHGPFPDAQFLATGGIALDDVAAYFAAGARAVGLGAVFGADAADTRARTGRLLDGLIL